MVGASARKPPFLSGAGIFPLAARQSVVDQLADGDTGRVRSHDFGYGRCLRPAGAAYVCNRTARGGRPLPGLFGRTAPAGQGSASARSVALDPGDAGKARDETFGN